MTEADGSFRKEKARLEILDNLGIVGAEPNAVFGIIATEAAEAINAQKFSIDIVTQNQVWPFVAKGIVRNAVPRDQAPASRVIDSHQYTTEAGDIGVFTEESTYLGIPILSKEGMPIAVLSLYTEHSKSLTPWQKDHLLKKSGQLSRQFEYFFGRRTGSDESQILSLLDYMKGAHIILDSTGVIIQANVNASELLGYRNTELIGKPVETLLATEKRKKHEMLRREYQKNAYPKPMGGQRKQYSIINGAMEPLHLEVDLTPVYSDSGKQFVVATLHDATDRVATRKLLEEKWRVGDGSACGEEVIAEIAYTINRELLPTWVTIGRVLPDKQTVQTEIFLANGKQVENFRYPLEGTPCHDVVNDKQCMVTGELASQYPDDPMIRQMGAKAYVGTVFTNEKGEPHGVISVIYDRTITEKRAELCLQLLKLARLHIIPVFKVQDTGNTINKLMKSVELSPNGVAITDRDANIEYVNARYCELTGFPREECLGQKPSLNASGDTPRETYERMWKTILAGDVWQGELQNRRKDGTTYWARTKIFPITDSHDIITHFVSIQEDISRDKELTAKLRYEATHDQLTDLLSRREFERRLGESINCASENGSTHSICYMDLDHFKVINDTSGHIAGDILIRRVGEILKRSVRSNDLAARLGGDEFGIILFDCSSEQAYPIAEKVLKAINDINFMWEGKTYRIGCSIGIAEIVGDEKGSVDVIRKVDTACYAAKDKGRGNIHIYHQDNRASYQRLIDSDWIPEINAAFEHQHFILYVQPIVPVCKVSTPEVEDAYYHEILVRLVDAKGCVISPGQFFPTLERYSMASRMDRYILEHVFDWARENPHLTEHMNGLGINLSGSSLTDCSLLDYIIESLTSGGLDARKFKFEITETAAITNIIEARNFMSELRVLGCEVILDDFGSGLSSFSYLKNLPVDVIKIDGDMIREIARDQSTCIMVKTINEMAHNLGCKTVAEYVEDSRIMDHIADIGVDYAQGFAVDRPYSIDSLTNPDNRKPQ